MDKRFRRFGGFETLRDAIAELIDFTGSKSLTELDETCRGMGIR